MRRVSDNGANAPISALTYAFSIGSIPTSSTASFGLKCRKPCPVLRLDDGPRIAMLNRYCNETESVATNANHKRVKSATQANRVNRHRHESEPRPNHE